MIGDEEDRRLMAELHGTSEAWTAAFGRVVEPHPVVSFPAPMQDPMNVWFRRNRKCLWHRWAEWFASPNMLAPVCGLATAIAPRFRREFRAREDVPGNARICKGCDQ